MASGFFAILDDIAALMDDVAINAKLATQKTAGILGDDLAVNAEKSTGFVSSRELPVLWAITKGSFINKLIIVPITLLLNLFLPSAIIAILILGGFYLAFEGIEKIVEYLFHNKHHKKQPENQQDLQAEVEEIQNDDKLEKVKIKSAVTTDFILSIEIVIIALSTVLDKSLFTQIYTVSIVSIIATIGVYGLVALIVRMDDFGFKLIEISNKKGFLNALGELLVKALPIVIKILAVVGTIALLLVSGGIFAHNIELLHHFLPNLNSIIKELLLGVLGGIFSLFLVTIGKKLILIFKK
jgi:predicted DNA repair protein MutK